MNTRTVLLPSNLHLVAFLFKDEGGLAKHLLISPHQEVFGYQEKARKRRKGRENYTQQEERKFGATILLSDDGLKVD